MSPIGNNRYGKSLIGQLRPEGIMVPVDLVGAAISQVSGQGCPRLNGLINDISCPIMMTQGNHYTAIPTFFYKGNGPLHFRGYGNKSDPSLSRFLER